jgi:hypothetical protein
VGQVPGFGQPNAKKTTVTAQPVVLKSIAKLANNFNSGKNQDIESLRILFESLKTGRLDLSHANKTWRYYQVEASARPIEFPGLAEYLPKEEEGNRDIGQFNAADCVMRFGSKHNDIYPIIGDMIRWLLKLPNRHIIKP